MNFNLRTFRLYGGDLWGGLLLSPTLTRTLKHLILLRRSAKRFSSRKRFIVSKPILVKRRRVPTTMRFIHRKLADDRVVKSTQFGKSNNKLDLLVKGKRGRVNSVLRKLLPYRFFSNRVTGTKKFMVHSKTKTPHYVVDFLKSNPFDKVFVSSKRRTFLSQLAMNFRKFQKFYSNINRSQFMRLAYLARLQKSHNLHFFINKLERRLDMVLFRTGLSTSLFMAKHLISYKHVLVNSELISTPSFEVALYNKVSISTLASHIVRNHFWFRFSNFLRFGALRKTSRSYFPIVHFFSCSSYEIDYKSLSSILIAEVFFNSIYYPFKIDPANIELYINRAKKRLTY